MFNTARTSAKTLLVAAGTAGFVALGAGIAGADTLGGVTDGLPLGDLGSQVPASLTEGVATPLGDLVKVEPGQISADPDVQHQSASEKPAGRVVGDSVSTEVPVETGEENATTVGPFDLGSAAEDLPLAAGASDPVSGLTGGLGLLDGIGLGSAAEGLPLAAGASDPLSGLTGGLGLLDGIGLGSATESLPLAAGASPVHLQGAADKADAAVNEVGATAEQGTHEIGGGLSELDGSLPTSGEALPLAAAADTPVAPVTGENTDLTGGATTLLPELGVEDTLRMSGSELADGSLGDVLPQAATVTDAADGVQGLPELPAPGEALPLAASTASDSVTDVVSGDLLDNDLVGVQGLPELGEPEVNTEALPELPEASDLGDLI